MVKRVSKVNCRSNLSHFGSLLFYKEMPPLPPPHFLSQHSPSLGLQLHKVDGDGVFDFDAHLSGPVGRFEVGRVADAHHLPDVVSLG